MDQLRHFVCCLFGLFSLHLNSLVLFAASVSFEPSFPPLLKLTLCSCCMLHRVCAFATGMVARGVGMTCLQHSYFLQVLLLGPDVEAAGQGCK